MRGFPRRRQPYLPPPERLHFLDLFVYANKAKKVDKPAFSLIAQVAEPFSEQRARLTQDLLQRNLLILNPLKNLTARRQPSRLQPAKNRSSRLTSQQLELTQNRPIFTYHPRLPFQESVSPLEFYGRVSHQAINELSTATQAENRARDILGRFNIKLVGEETRSSFKS